MNADIEGLRGGLMLGLLYAMAPSGGQGGDSSSGFLNFLPFIMVVIIFYLLLIRPQQKKQKEHQEKLNRINKGDRIITINKGDRIITTSGIYGTIVGIDEDKIQVRIADKVKVDMLKNAVATILQPESTEVQSQ
jgi:preprotein translocase subunit YajC